MMQNQTLIQYFHWYYNEPDRLWIKAAKEAGNLKKMGITTVWFPPACKGSNGGYSEGYDSYDLYDLGEFDQKNTVATKYGTKAEYLNAINQLHKQGLKVLADVVLNHKAGGDELERIKVRKVDKENRTQYISDEFEIEAWTKFTFPGRKGQYSQFIWDYRCFSGVDWAQDLNESAIFAIQNHYGAGWEKVPSAELGNYDYLMFDDIDYRNQAVVREMNNWGKWFYQTTKIDGFRLDAVKHISAGFIIEWLDEMRRTFDRDFFVVAENWNVIDAETLEKYIELTGGRTQLFDSLLHHNLYLASISDNTYDMRSIFDNTLVHRNPFLAITFVDNHDSQPMQALESFIDFWFRPLAYALILLRVDGTPCIFYADVYGASYEDKGATINLAALAELPALLSARANVAYGGQHDYLDHSNCIGWTRQGDPEHPGSGMAVLMSNGGDGFKFMEIGKDFTGKVFIDILGKRNEEVCINEDGFGEFFCNARSVSVWVLK